MAKRLKRAFTITELVIVIAVIAILAAVLIPTFANIINNANESSDIQAVREMNIALSNAEALDGKPETLTEVLEILEEAGMDANQYKALANDRKLVWDSTLNRVLYVTLDNAVMFPEEYADTEYVYGTWITLTGQMAGDDSWMMDDNRKRYRNHLQHLRFRQFRTHQHCLGSECDLYEIYNQYQCTAYVAF